MFVQKLFLDSIFDFLEVLKPENVTSTFMRLMILPEVGNSIRK